MIVLDTNQLRHAAFPQGAVLGMPRVELESSFTVFDNDGRPVQAHGARDAVIWLTILEAAGGTGEELWFVSKDGGFGPDAAATRNGLNALSDAGSS
ncbi:hypothetical protein OG828_06210 [Streptomyces sp. NBC_00457]|uniref:hypothetical protein n=1 Tax=Streptomyces sp. NBC_00457 TaxID=2975748 RepID=UPI002E1D1F2B